MSNGAGRPVPKIDDAFWFDYSVTLVKNAQDNREKAAEKFKDLVKWLWPIYTAGAAIGFSLTGKALPLWEKILIAAAGASLILVYWSTLTIELPRLVAFDPRSPTEIKAAYKEVILSKQKWLRLSAVLSILAAFLVSLALLIASVSKDEKPVSPAMKAAIIKADSAQKLAVTASVGKTDKVMLTFRPIKGVARGAEACPILLTPDEGMVYASLPLNQAVPPLEVSLEWKDASGTKIMVTKEVQYKDASVR
jgi:hypothetical protein